MRITRENIAWWQKNLKKGSYVKYQQYMEEQKIDIVHNNNYQSIWIEYSSLYIKTIEWNDVLEIYTKDQDPEYFI